MKTRISTDLYKRPLEGFGARLKEERRRLQLSQTQLGEVGGVARLAQLQYESEATSPTIRYLTAIGEAGVDLNYLLFGVHIGSAKLTAEQMDKLEERAFALVEAVAEKRPDGRLGAQTRRYLVHMIMNVLVQIEHGELPENTDIGSLISVDMTAKGTK